MNHKNRLTKSGMLGRLERKTFLAINPFPMPTFELQTYPQPVGDA